MQENTPGFLINNISIATQNQVDAKSRRKLEKLEKDVSHYKINFSIFCQKRLYFIYTFGKGWKRSFGERWWRNELKIKASWLVLQGLSFYLNLNIVKAAFSSFWISISSFRKSTIHDCHSAKSRVAEMEKKTRETGKQTGVLRIGSKKRDGVGEMLHRPANPSSLLHEKMKARWQAATSALPTSYTRLWKRFTLFFSITFSHGLLSHSKPLCLELTRRNISIMSGKGPV